MENINDVKNRIKNKSNKSIKKNEKEKCLEISDRNDV